MVVSTTKFYHIQLWEPEPHHVKQAPSPPYTIDTQKHTKDLLFETAEKGCFCVLIITGSRSMPFGVKREEKDMHVRTHMHTRTAVVHSVAVNAHVLVSRGSGETS